MSELPVECVLALGYAAFLALVAFLLELGGRHAYRRSLQTSTTGFTYHPERDIWRCPEDQHLFPVFSDSLKGTRVYKAPASACNSCRSKAACTDSNSGREIMRIETETVEYGMKRFHRGLSLMLLFLAILILAVEIFRMPGESVRFTLAVGLILLCAVELWAFKSFATPANEASPK